MDKERFSILLQDPSQVTNADIKALNEYRKKYPYFQSLYVVVAKALRDREHPKTDAFIKKAAIYSANRSHLKEIIEGDFTFGQKVEEPETKPVVTTEPINKPTENKVVEQKVEKDSVEKPKEKLEEKKQEKVEDKKVDPEKVVQKPVESKKEDASATKETANPPSTTPNKEQESKVDDDLAEIEAAKRRIEALLSGQLDTSEEEKTAKSVSTKKKKQIEIIEKFIQNEPQIDRERMAQAESNVDIEDLADKSILKEEAFETETLAELMAKQGKTKKAEEIYKKLSLKFPEKSAYFATRIEKLKS